jgi:hypothetical protein
VQNLTMSPNDATHSRGMASQPVTGRPRHPR